jgi:hypothetical protein
VRVPKVKPREKEKGLVMGFRAVGQVVAVEVGFYPDKRTGERIDVFDAWIAATDPRFAADKISGPAHDAPEVGDYVDVPVRIISGATAAGNPYLIVRQIPEPPAALGKAS